MKKAVTAPPIENKFNLAICSAIGALTPDILLLYSKRWTTPNLKFDFTLYVTATLFYITLAGFVAYIFPYSMLGKKQKNLKWAAFCIGVGLPIVIAIFTTIVKGRPIAPRGEIVPGNLWDLISLY